METTKKMRSAKTARTARLDGIWYSKEIEKSESLNKNVDIIKKTK